MEEMQLDVLVIGFGKAGKTIAMKRGAAGDRVGLLEQSSDMYGGTCINIGCIPTKSLLTSLHDYKIASAQASVDSAVAFEKAQERRNAFIAKLNSVNKAMADGANVAVIDGFGSFLSAKEVLVFPSREAAEAANGGTDGALLKITAETIIINTGAEPIMLGAPKHPRIVDSTGVQFLPERPGHLAILGAGPIALEFATMFAGFGAKITMLDRDPDILPRFDKDVVEVVKQEIAKLDVTIKSGVTVAEFAPDDSGVTLKLDSGEEVRADYALIAIGRKAATGGLGLENAGIETLPHGPIKVDEYCRTNVDGVYAAGDVNGGPQFTYVSFDDHRVIMDHRWGAGAKTTQNRVIPTTTFLNPPLSQVGMSEVDALKFGEESGHEVSVRLKPIADIPLMPRPKILSNPAGVAKFIVDTTDDKILGATLYCVDSQELINTVALAIAHGIPATAVGNGIYTHPSSSEVFNALLV